MAEPHTPTRRPRRRAGITPSNCRAADLPLSVWPCAQRTAQCQRRGRFVPESNRHPGKMLPELARRAIASYSNPGDVVLDPMCGIGTTIVEASHAGRYGIGVELEDRWAALAVSNVEHARGQGAKGPALVVPGDARCLGDGLLDDFAGKVALVLTSPPYANADVGDAQRGNGMARTRASEGRSVSAADLVLAAELKAEKRYGDSAGSVARLRYGTPEEAFTPPPMQESYLSAMRAIYAACARMLEPGGYLVLVVKNMRWRGALRNISGDTTIVCQRLGLVYQQHIIALLATLRDDGLLPRPSFFQLTQVRRARALGRRTHLVCHEDVLVFQRDPKVEPR